MSEKLNVIDINNNPNFDRLFIDILLCRNDSEILNGKITYSSEKIMEMIGVLSKPLQDALFLVYGIPNGTPKSLEKAGIELGITRQGMNVRLNKALKELAKTARLYSILGKENTINLNTSIRDLIWSERAFNGLIRNNINTVGDLILQDRKTLSRLRNIGVMSQTEILAKINEIYEVCPEAHEVIDQKRKQELALDSHISVLNLPTALYNGLARNDITTIEALLKTDVEFLRGIRNFGKKKVQEVLKIQSRLYSLYPELIKSATEEEVKIAEPPSELEELKAEKQNLLDKEKVIAEKEKRAKALTKAFATIYSEKAKDAEKMIGD